MADKRLKDFTVTTAVTSTTAVYVDRGIGVSESEQAEAAVLVRAGATTTPAAGVVPKADGAGLLPAAFLPAATTSVAGAAVLATPSSDVTAGHVVQANDTRLSDARTPTAHNHNASDINAGTLGVARGGTGAGTLAAHGLLVGNGTSAVAVTGAGSAGQVLTSNGASADPTFQAPAGPSGSAGGDLGSTYPNPTVTATHLASPLPVAQGGSGAATLAAHGVVVGNGTGAVAVTGAGTAGQVLTSNGASADPTFQTPSSGGLVSRKTASETRTSTSTPSDDSDLELPSVPTGTYDLEIFIHGYSNSTVGFQANLSGTATFTAPAWSSMTDGTGSAWAVDASTNAVFPLDPLADPDNPTYFSVHIVGVLIVTGSGSVVVQWAQVVSSATNTVVLKAYIKATSW